MNEQEQEYSAVGVMVAEARVVLFLLCCAVNSCNSNGTAYTFSQARSTSYTFRIAYIAVQ